MKYLISLVLILIVVGCGGGSQVITPPIEEQPLPPPPVDKMAGLHGEWTITMDDASDGKFDNLKVIISENTVSVYNGDDNMKIIETGVVTSYGFYYSVSLNWEYYAPNLSINLNTYWRQWGHPDLEYHQKIDSYYTIDLSENPTMPNVKEVGVIFWQEQQNPETETLIDRNGEMLKIP